jgi:hypothetical protein
MIKKLIITMVVMGFISFAYADIPYWIEDTGSGFNLWIKTSIPANGSILLNISKGGGHPDGDAVFVFFDDFEENELDTSKWTISGSPTLNNGYLYIPKNTYIESISNIDFSKSLVIETAFNIGWGGGTAHSYMIFYSSSDDTKYLRTHQIDHAGPDQWQYLEDSNGKIGSDYTVNTNNVLPRKIIWDSKTNETSYIIDGQTLADKIERPFISTLGNTKIKFYHEKGSNPFTIDYIRIRKYANPEPDVDRVNSSSDWVVVKITNPNSEDLTDFQVKISNNNVLNNLIQSKNENLTITDITNGNNNDDGNGGTTTKTPIPLLAVILTVMAIPIVALKRINNN